MAGSGDPDDSDRRVDFVVGAPDGRLDDGRSDDGRPDGKPEDLESEQRSRTRRLRIELGLGALVLLVVVLVSRAATGGSGTPQTATSGTPQTSYTLTPAPEPTGPVAAPPLPINGRLNLSLTPAPSFPSTLPHRTHADPMVCPQSHRCRTDVDIPRAVTRAVTTAIPESTVTLVETVRLRGAHPVLWFRTITVRAASEELIVQIQAPGKSDTTGASYRVLPSTGATTSYGSDLGPWHVRMRVLDPAGGRADPTVLARLAQDPRLVAG